MNRVASIQIVDRRSAFTLTETLVSLAAASTLMVGLGSTVYLAARSTDDSDRPTTNVVEASLSLDDVAADLHYAVSFIQRTNRAVEFTMADRTGDGAAETVRYEWSGVAGQPLMRTFNGGPAQTVRQDVHDFNLAYTIQTKEELPDETETEPAAPTETLAASFDGWSGITATTRTHSLASGYWVSEYFELPWPAGATSFRVTKLRLKVGQSSTLGSFSIGFYSAAGGTGPLPSTSLLGSQLLVATSGLPGTPDWKEFTFSDVTMTNATSGYNILVKGVVAGGRLGYLQAAAAPQDARVMKFSNNSGSTWSPSASLEKTNDVQFEVHGVFEGANNQPDPEPIERHFVRAVNIHLQTGDDAQNRVQTAVDILNSPEVATP